MAVYTIRTHHNETDTLEASDNEYDMPTDSDSASFQNRERYSEDEVRLRLLEAMNTNIANLAASAERIASALEAIGKQQVGAY